MARSRAGVEEGAVYTHANWPAVCSITAAAMPLLFFAFFFSRPVSAGGLLVFFLFGVRGLEQRVGGSSTPRVLACLPP